MLLQVISLGHKESITILQVKQNCEMESHEEKLHKIIIQACVARCHPTACHRCAQQLIHAVHDQQSKINDTKDVMKKRANEIEKSKMETKAKMSSMLPSSLQGSASSTPAG